jgi:hypothetical protein
MIKLLINNKNLFKKQRIFCEFNNKSMEMVNLECQIRASPGFPGVGRVCPGPRPGSRRVDVFRGESTLKNRHFLNL